MSSSHWPPNRSGVEKSSLTLHLAARDHPHAFGPTRVATTTVERCHLAHHRVRVFHAPFLLRNRRCSAECLHVLGAHCQCFGERDPCVRKVPELCVQFPFFYQADDI